MTSKLQWSRTNSWIACFDILGFKEWVKLDESNGLKIENLVEDYENILIEVSESLGFGYEDVDVRFCWISDTFIFFTKDMGRHSFMAIKDIACAFIEKCLLRLVPIRGAISAGHIIFSSDLRVFMGSGFINAFEYAEAQDWIGLVLTPQALAEINQLSQGVNIKPFIESDEIPMKKGYSKSAVRAYCFQLVEKQSYRNPVIECLDRIKNDSPPECHDKYKRTISFIERHHKWIL